MTNQTNVFQEILQELTGIMPDTTALLALTRQVKLEPGEAYIREGDTAKKLGLIQQGIMRAYAVKENGDEATLFLRWEGQLIASHDTIIHHKPARFIYRTLEAVTLLELDYDMLEEVLKKHPEYEPLRSYFLMKMLAESLGVIELFVTLSPEERYRQMVENRWNILNRVPDKYIASMLGVTPVSLSRIRKRLYGKK